MQCPQCTVRNENSSVTHVASELTDPYEEFTDTRGKHHKHYLTKRIQYKCSKGHYFYLEREQSRIVCSLLDCQYFGETR